MDLPKTIFKYEPFALRAIQNLKASAVHFGSPLSFNDPYDCALPASIAECSREELEMLRSECINGNVYPEEVRSEVSGLSLDQFDAKIRSGALLVVDQARSDFLKRRGVTCFSETNDNLLMWSHYGGRYRGYCLEFHTKFEPFKLLQKVQYVAEVPQFKLSDFIRNENHRKLTDMFCTKSVDWSYEKEWRILHAEAGTLYSYDREALKAIYFGPDIDAQDRDLLCHIMYCQFPDAELWFGKRISASFRVVFEMVTNYLPYAEARRRGLL